MHPDSRAAPTGTLPRRLTTSTLWTGGCIEFPYRGEMIHSHMGAFVIKGERTMMVDTGHPYHTKEVFAAVTDFLDGRPLDYIFLTHFEYPHAGLIAPWMARYPDAVMVGDLPDMDLYYPDLAPRTRMLKAGDRIDLGDREILFVPAIWRDLRSTLWAFDTRDRILYTADAFAYLHYHLEGQCDRTSSEQPEPDIKMIQFFNERTMNWTRYTDAASTFRDIDRLIRELDPLMIAGAHGSVIDASEDMIPRIKHGMLVGTDVVAAPEAAQ